MRGSVTDCSFGCFATNEQVNRDIHTPSRFCALSSKLPNNSGLAQVWYVSTRSLQRCPYFTASPMESRQQCAPSMWILIKDGALSSQRTSTASTYDMNPFVVEGITHGWEPWSMIVRPDFLQFKFTSTFPQKNWIIELNTQSAPVRFPCRVVMIRALAPNQMGLVCGICLVHTGHVTAPGLRPKISLWLIIANKSFAFISVPIVFALRYLPTISWSNKSELGCDKRMLCKRPSFISRQWSYGQKKR